MSQEFQYAVATLAGWAGWFFVFRALFLGFKLIAKSPGFDAERTLRALPICIGAAFVLLLIGRFTPTTLGRPLEGEGIRIPIVWFYTHFWGWLVVVSLFFVIANAVQSWLAINAEEGKARMKIMGGWAITGLVSGYFFNSVGASISVFRGAFYLSVTTVVILALLTVLVLMFMAFTARRASTRSVSKTLWTHTVLILGCVIFGLPFAWLLSSSFKEDKDMAGGIVWIPRVTERLPYLDPKDRQFQGQFRGITVTGSPIETKPDGSIQIDILTPFSMRGQTFVAKPAELKEIPKYVPVVFGKINAVEFRGKVIEEMPNGDRRVQFLNPPQLANQTQTFTKEQVTENRPQGLRWQNFPEALQFLPPETNFGLVYLKNTLLLVVLSVIGTLISCALVAYAFSRMRFPGRELLFKVLLATMMLPGAVTLMPQFLIFKNLGWIDTLLPLWVPAFFAGAFNVFMLRQFFGQIPMELEDAAKIDGCNYFRAFWSVMMPQVKPALAVIAIWTFMGTWNNFMGPLIYINSPENMPIAYALQLFNGDRGGEPGLLMAFATLTMLPVLALFFFAQKYFIEGVTLSGLGGR